MCIRDSFKSADEDDRIGLEYGGETPVYYQHLSWLQEQLSILHRGLSADNLRALMVKVQDMYKEFGIDADTDFSKLMPLDYPTYTDLYTCLLYTSTSSGTNRAASLSLRARW